jgi:hypothetical protein
VEIILSPHDGLIGFHRHFDFLFGDFFSLVFFLFFIAVESPSTRGAHFGHEPAEGAHYNRAHELK